MGGGYTALGAARQDRTRSFNLRFLLLALVTFSVVAGLYLVESRRSSAIAREMRASETRELDDRYGREAERIEKRLQELKTQAIRAIPFADRRRFPSGVVSASVWMKSPTGVTRALGLEPEGVWEQALYRVLPAEIAKRHARVVLPLVGPELAADPSSETLRLALFPEPDSRISAIAFRPSSLFGEIAANDGMKRILIEESGLVLAHTNPSEVGMRTSALANLFREAAAGDPGRAHRLDSKSWEGFPSTIRFARLGGWSAFFVVEKVHAPVKAATSPWMLLIFTVGGLLGTLFAGIAFMRPRKPRAPESPAVEIPAAVAVPIVDVPVAKAPARTAPRQGLRELRANPPPFVPRPSAISLSPRDLDSELGKFLSARIGKSATLEENRIAREKILLDEFEADARKTRDVERLERKLVESVSGATKSPALFFRYDPAQGIARLSSEAGYPASQSIIGAGGMSFALDTGLVTDIHAEVARGRQVNLWAYAPLARVMMSRLGIAGFEAWPMTLARKPNAGPSQLLGILVIAESGVDSVLHRDFLGALLERASRHYARQNL